MSTVTYYTFRTLNGQYEFGRYKSVKEAREAAWAVNKDLHLVQVSITTTVMVVPATLNEMDWNDLPAGW